MYYTMQAMKAKRLAEDCQCAPRVRLKEGPRKEGVDRFTSRISMQLSPQPCLGGESLVIFQVLLVYNWK